MASTASGGTDVEVLTNLAVTGKPAQFGRGVMQDVSDKLLGQFVACLEQRLGADAPPPVADPHSTTAPEPPAGAAPQTVAAPVEEGAGSTPPDPAPPPVPATAPAVGAGAASPAAAAVRADDAINLGSTVLPILVKSYWKPALAVLVAIAVIVVLVVAL
jgi:hypothetical protein